MTSAPETPPPRYPHPHGLSRMPTPERNRYRTKVTQWRESYGMPSEEFAKLLGIGIRKYALAERHNYRWVALTRKHPDLIPFAYYVLVEDQHPDTYVCTCSD